MGSGNYTSLHRRSLAPFLLPSAYYVESAVTTMKSLHSDRVIYPKAQGQGQNWKAELPPPNPGRHSVSLDDISFPPSLLFIWGWFAPLKTSPCLATSPQDVWVCRKSVRLMWWEDSVYTTSPHLGPCLLLLRLLSRFSSAPPSFLHSKHEPWLYRRCCSALSPLLPQSPAGQLNQEPCPCGFGLGPAHPCAKGPIQEG